MLLRNCPRLRLLRTTQPADPSKEHNCIPDEHYVQTLQAIISIMRLSTVENGAVAKGNHLHADEMFLLGVDHGILIA
ncbi:hypothetical protein FNV43_RR21000 [Rhamnella rubrinervis]|uniref:Uncharacterized protein n=1 Tax=Rhamnella rubrinervis TaxID=2594499 RepID=A0A8K0E1U0_9ROSA|nr:hypothetical protein FNV43_RR21000 [Rhamnella rubrinervis]